MIRVESYNPVDMSLLVSDVSIVDFGDAVRGQFAPNVIVLRAIPDLALDGLALFLEDNDGLDYTSFGKMKSSLEITGVEPGDARISDFFVEYTGVSDFTHLERGLELNPANPEYVWIDAEVGVSENPTLSPAGVNLRFVFEYV